MLNILHKTINDIVPIIGITQEDNNYIIEYVNQPNQEQLTLINAVINDWPLEQAKLLKIAELDLSWSKKLKNGWVTPLGWKLGITTEDVTLLSGAFILAKEAAEMGITDLANIIDSNGVSHSIMFSEFVELMLEYGQYRTSISLWYSEKLSNIKSATSINQVNNIII
jgi:hypothetical protein